MASKTAKRWLVVEKVDEKVAAEPKRGRRGAKVVKESEETTLKACKDSKASKSKKEPPPSPSTQTTSKPARRGRPRKGTLGVRLSKKTVEEDTPEVVVEKVKAILIQSVVDEQALVDNDQLSNDSDDEVDLSMAKNINNLQDTMEGNTDYTEPAKNVDAEEAESEGDEDMALDLTHNTSKLRSITMDTSIYDDPEKDPDSWWTEDATREPTLCDLWREEKCLYDVGARCYMSEDRQTILKRFATILQVPVFHIEKRMAALRNLYQRLHRQCKSGSEPDGRTDRQKEVLRLLFFLRQHIKTSASLSSYKGTSPAKADKVKGRTVLKSTPKVCRKSQARVVDVDGEDENDVLDLSQILQDRLTPIKSKSKELTLSEDGAGSEDEFVLNVKHYGRNDRLHDAKTVEATVRRSPRLPPAKKSDKRELLKNSDISSCKDTAPKASTSKDPKSVYKQRKGQPEPKAGKNDSPTISGSNEEVQNAGTGKVLTAVERMSAYRNEKEKATKSHQSNEQFLDMLRTKKPSEATAADRKALMACASSSASATFDVTLDQAWNEKRGPAYRKQQELEKKKKEADKQQDIATLLQEKNDIFKKVSEGIQNFHQGAYKGVGDVCAEQLWADSLVPHLKRMDDDVKDEYMVHVLGLAMKAIRGKWP